MTYARWSGVEVDHRDVQPREPLVTQTRRPVQRIYEFASETRVVCNAVRLTARWLL
jgi:hypothetical protein